MNLYTVQRLDGRKHPFIHELTVRARDERSAIELVRQASTAHPEPKELERLKDWADVLQDTTKFKVSAVASNTLGDPAVLHYRTTTAAINNIGPAMTPRPARAPTGVPPAVGVAGQSAIASAQAELAARQPPVIPAETTVIPAEST
jgi:hypothetical protein